MKSERIRTGILPEERDKMRDKGALNSTEKLVCSLRLRKIEKEHTSIGALLDNRTLFDLDDPEKFRPIKAKSDKVKGKRENIFGLDKVEVAEMAAKLHQESKLQMNSSKVSYETEELIWKTKSKASDYFLKRQFEKPELCSFFSSLKPEHRQKFKVQCRERLYDISNKLRAKCQISLTVMSDVFHPEANIHRAHCQYIMKLYKSITAENIEDPVLQKYMVIITHHYNMI